MKHRPTVLIVDDQVDNQKLLVRLLKADYRLLVASNGEEALNALGGQTLPDLILLDIMMPGMDGYETCATMKRQPRLARIPVIFLTARTDPDSEARGFHVGGVDFVSKPVNPAVLRARLAAQLALAAQIRDAWTERDRYQLDAERLSQERNEIEALARKLEHEIEERKRTEIAWLESQARFSRLTEHLQDKLVFFSRTLSGELLYLSEGAECLGIGSPRQARGQSWWNLFAWLDDSLERERNAERELITGVESIPARELTYRDADGEPRSLLVHEYRIYDQERCLDLIEGIALDITEQKARESELRTLNLAIEQAPVSIEITDPEGRILYVNPHFSRVSGYAPEEIIGRNPRLLKSGQVKPETYRDLWETIQRGEIWRGELINKNKAGNLIWESVAIAPIFSERGAITHYVAIKEDIGDRKQLEQIRDDVERMMRHDLKNPLHAIVAIPELLLLDDSLNTEQRESIALIQEAGEAMQGLIELSLDIFKMETGQYHYTDQRLNLVDTLHQLRQLMEPRLRAKQLALLIELDHRPCPATAKVWVRGESRLLYNLLSNLLANAIEASPPQQTIRLELETPDQIVLAIRNRGAVPPGMREHFFEKYRTQGKPGGTGLGTYSAKLMADTMGLTLRMDTSDAEDSTCLWLSLPASQET